MLNLQRLKYTRTFFLVLFATIICSSLLIGYAIGAVSYDLDDTKYEKGSMLSGYTYIIYKDAEGIHYARNGITGSIDYQGLFFVPVIQNCINSLPLEGGSILLKPAMYIVTQTIIIDRGGVSIYGESMQDYSYGISGGIVDYSKLYLYNGVNEPIMEFYSGSDIPVNYINLKNLIFDGNKANQTTPTPILNFTGSIADLHIENVQIYNSKGKGISFVTGTHNVRKIYLEKVAIENCDDSGLYIDRSIGGSFDEGIIIETCEFWNNYRGMELIRITQSTTYAFPPRFLTINSNFVRNQREGIYLKYCEYVQFSHVSCFSNSYGSYNTYDGVNIDDSRFITFNYLDSKNVESPLLDETQRYGVYSSGTSDYVKILTGDLTDNLSGETNLVGTHNVILLVDGVDYDLGGDTYYVSGSGMLPNSYTLFTNVTGWYAINGTTGLIEYNSTTDATDVIQDSMDTIDDIGGGLIHLKNGFYPIDYIDGISNMIFEGEGWQTILFFKDGHSQDQTIFDFQYIYNTTLRDFALNCNKQGNTYDTNVVGGIRFFMSHNCRAENLFISNAYTFGMFTYGGVECIFDRCVVMNSTDNNFCFQGGVYQNVWSVRCVARDCVSYQCSDVGLSFVRANQCRYENCMVYNITHNDSEGAPNTHDAITFEGGNYDNVVQGCTIIGEGVFTGGGYVGEGSKMIDNIFLDVYSDINLGDGMDFINNIVHNNEGNGLRVWGSDCLIQGNQFYRETEEPNTEYAIYLQAVDSVHIFNNRIENYYAGIRFSTQYATNTVIRDNIFVNCEDSGNKAIISGAHYDSYPALYYAQDTLISDNIGFKTEAYGLAVIDDSTSVTFDHELDYLPQIVLCTFNDTAYDSYIWDVESETQISVTVKTSGTYLIYWRAYYFGQVVEVD